MSDHQDVALQPSAPARERPRALFAAPDAVLGLRAAAARGVGAVRTVSVWMYGDPPAGTVAAELWTLTGSPRAAPVGAGTIVPAALDAAGLPIPSHLDLDIAAVGEGLPGRAPYRLSIDPAGLAALGLVVDPLRAHVPVRLRPECGDAPDCLAAPAASPPLVPPDYDTLARDFTALRDMLLDRLLALDPDAELSEADTTVALIELMAHLGDVLNYRLDRASTETWLTTARRRATVTRHARLVDLPVPPAISAATVVQVHVRPTAAGADRAVAVRPGDTSSDALGAPAPQVGSHFTLELDTDVSVRASHGEIAIHDWGEEDAVLTAGATGAILVRPLPGSAVPLAQWLPVGALLAFEVVAPGAPGEQEDWARRRRSWPPTDAPPGPASSGPTRMPLASHPAQVVRLTEVAPFTDPLVPGVDLIRVRWSAADALTRDVPASPTAAGGVPRVGVARAGLFPAHHGLTIDGPGALVPFETLTGGHPDPATEAVAAYLLPQAGSMGLSCAPGGRPWQLETRVVLPGGTVVPAPRVTSMLRASPAGFSVVIDHDDEAPPLLRFTTGALGAVPPPPSVVTVRHQVGAGPSGNIAANVLRGLVRTAAPPGRPCVWEQVHDAVTARNLTPGVGGTAATALDAVRRDAPEAYAAEPRRAVLVGDLPPFALQVPGVARAAARRSWSGSWPVAVVTVEGRDDEPALPTTTAVASAMDAVRMVGHETVAVPATPVGLLVALTVCLTATTDSALARAEILARLRPGRPAAVFSPDSLALGSAIHLSAVVAAVAAVPGVDAVSVTEARRLGEPAGTLHRVLAMEPEEIAVCDDDLAAPDRGRLLLTVRGGR